MDKYEKIALYVTIFLLSASFIAFHFGTTYKDRIRTESPSIICDIQLGHLCDTTRGLITGHSYYLLEKYAEQYDCNAIISLNKKDTADIIVLPFPQEENDSIYYTADFDSLTVWATKDVSRKKRIETFLEKYGRSDEYKEIRPLFFNEYDPIRRAKSGKRGKYLSPYDDIIKEYADTLGWDWRLLTAVIYQESRFHINAKSHRGAIGLMQMMPFTANGIGEEDLLNPRTSIKAGTMYLGHLSRRYRRVADNNLEQVKFTLAAYNAGAGRMTDVLNYARFKGVPIGTWESLCSVMPEMADSAMVAQCDTLKLGVFKGVETRTYVDRVMTLYEAFKKICP